MNLPETGFLREAQILPQREITAEEAALNREAYEKAAAEARQAGRKPKVDNRPRRPRPASPGLIPVGHATWWRGVKSGRFPQPVKLGGRITCWRVEDIRALIANGIAS